MSKTSEQRIKIYLSKLSKYKNKVLKEKYIKDVIERSDISDSDIKNIEMHFSKVYDRAQQLERIGKLSDSLKELETVYLYSLHSKSIFASFFSLYNKLVKRIYSKGIERKLLHVSLQAREFGIISGVNLRDYDEAGKLKHRVLILLLNFILIAIVSLITYTVVLTFIIGHSEDLSGVRNIQETIVQGLPSVTRISDLIVEFANFVAKPYELYSVEVEDAKVLVFEYAHTYQLKAGVVSAKNPIKKISYGVTVYDDLGKSILNKVFEKTSNFSNQWSKGVYVPIDFTYNISKEIKGHPKKMVLNIILIEFFEEGDNFYNVNLETSSSIVNFKYLGSYFNEDFGIYEANSLIEVYNNLKDVIKDLEVEFAYIAKDGQIIRSLRRKLIAEPNSFLKPYSRQSFSLKTIFPKEIYPNIKEELSFIKILNVFTR
ncbi:hypothetical protein BmHG_00084 [Borrelia miyamotoi]|uniref:Uncharacterized protein n=1 Tax=Borrelia miyamotoi TaxID=47466 RepID=A0AAP9CG11_9SPIR|nr:hypothetical protein [Borrelia miyamotoi]AHH05336.1 Hypothetical protein BOM_0793 [Borrelia miyamotoi FR64b]ATQ15097.1 hypothetical protein CNO14_03855 [Borrelia miyamotoi]ATQ16279.1 hypothetical protein CNO13_03855 [Borrelia miyamotoi]ATQ17423.1 hypothetical protein CNO12_03860 [Borrelia miyamotoi]ATQ18075.1 hypothetical protein CNO11_00395 [Borrelia miyamotoi]